MQVMVVEAARHLLGLEMAGSTEFYPETPDPVIDLMPDQEAVTQMGGTMRLGVYPCRMVEGSISVSAYGREKVDERHRQPFRVQQQLQRGAGGGRTTGRRSLPRWQARRDHGDGRPALHGGGAVPSGVPFAAQPSAPAVPRVRPRRFGGSARGRTAFHAAGARPCVIPAKGRNPGTGHT